MPATFDAVVLVTLITIHCCPFTKIKVEQRQARHVSKTACCQKEFEWPSLLGDQDMNLEIVELTPFAGYVIPVGFTLIVIGSTDAIIVANGDRKDGKDLSIMHGPHGSPEFVDFQGDIFLYPDLDQT
jgi:hypothetical protein